MSRAHPLRMALTVLALGAGPLGCTEDAITGFPPDSAPGQAGQTVEIAIAASDLPGWRDTTYVGFELPSSAGFRLVADSARLTARLLGRLTTAPDSIFIDSAEVAVRSFDAARLRLTIDTARSALPGGGAQVTVHALLAAFNVAEATWEEAASGVPWSAPGGDLGALLGTVSIDSLADSVRVPIQVNADSLIATWRAGAGEPGFAVSVAGAGASLRIGTVAVEMDARPEGLDTTVAIVRSATPTTFIHDPEIPPPTNPLRLAGIPAARFYLRFDLPERVQGVELRGAAINRAVLEFRPLAPPPEPFALENLISTTTFRLLTDPFVGGEKTPVGESLGSLALLDPDSLAAGQVLRLPITQLVAEWAAADPDSVPPLRIGVRALPETQELGFWEFGSSKGGPGSQPILRLLVTPRTVFRLP